MDTKEVTYAIVIRKEYQNIVTTLSEVIYEVVDVYDSFEMADNMLKNTEGELLSNLNKIDSNGFFKSFQSKILPMEGKYDKTQAQSIVNVLKDKVFIKKEKSL